MVCSARGGGAGLLAECIMTMPLCSQSRRLLRVNEWWRWTPSSPPWPLGAKHTRATGFVHDSRECQRRHDNVVKTKTWYS